MRGLRVRASICFQVSDAQSSRLSLSKYVGREKSTWIAIAHYIISEIVSTEYLSDIVWNGDHLGPFAFFNHTYVSQDIEINCDREIPYWTTSCCHHHRS